MLPPTRVQPFTVTWTGALLAAAAHAGLTYLQDVICAHLEPAPDKPGSRAPRGVSAIAEHPGLHQVVLILRTQAGRHVQR
jgi:hypothetical protein